MVQRWGFNFSQKERSSESHTENFFSWKDVKKTGLQSQRSPVPCGSLQAEPHLSVSAAWEEGREGRLSCLIQLCRDPYIAVGPQLKVVIPWDGIGLSYIPYLMEMPWKELRTFCWLHVHFMKIHQVVRTLTICAIFCKIISLFLKVHIITQCILTNM